MAVSNYSFLDVNVIWGLIEFEEFADGDDVVVVTPAGPQFNLLVGAKGDGAKSQTSDNSCTIAVKFLGTSKTVKLLANAYILLKEGKLSNQPMWITNKTTGKKQAVASSWIMGEPSSQEGQNSPIITYTFQGMPLVTTYDIV